MGEQVARVVPDGVEEVRLAQPGLPIDEQGVVGLGRRLRDGQRGRVGEPVARTDDEGVEGVLRVEPGQFDLFGHGRAGAGTEGARRTGACDGPVAAVVVILVVLDQGDAVELCATLGPAAVGIGGLGVVEDGRGGARTGLVDVGRSVCGGRVGRAVRQGLVDGHGQAHVVTELAAQGLGDAIAQPRLDDVLGEVVRNGDQGRLVEQPHESGQGEEGALLDGDPVGIERIEGGAPDLVHPDIRHRITLSFRVMSA